MRAEILLRERVETLAASLAARGAVGTSLAIVCGSGFASIAEELEDRAEIPFAELAGMPTVAPRSASGGPRAAEGGIPGHTGRFVLGELAGEAVLVQAGRLHLYEGWSPFEVTASVRAFALLGLRGVLLTNAAGGIRAGWPAGTLMRITDHLDLQGRSPLLRHERTSGSPYDPALGEALERAGERSGVAVVRGIYAGLLGPAYETVAEIRALARLGADAVGMSTVGEAAAARAAGLRVAGLSLIANPAAGCAPAAAEQLDHGAVLAAGAAAAGRVAQLLREAVPALAEVLTQVPAAPSDLG